MPTDNTPNVAIITRSCNRSELLERAIQSVLAQTFTNWIHIIVNDGGDKQVIEDTLLRWKAAYQGRYKTIHLRKNRGMQAASNVGIQKSKSEYITIHDDDDTWDPDFLKHTVAFLEAEGAGSRYQGVISQTTLIRETRTEDGRYEEISREAYLPQEEINFFRFAYRNPFPPIAFLYRRQAHDTVGMFNPAFDVAGDMEFNFRFLQHFEIGVLQQPLANYHWRIDTGADSEANSVLAQRELHKRKFNELKNHYLRLAGEANPGIHGLVLNLAHFLVEAEWQTAANYHALQRVDQRCYTLFEDISGDSYRDRYSTIREGLAILIDHARDTGVRDKLTGLVEAFEHWIRQDQTQELLRTLQLLHQQINAIQTDFSASQKQQALYAENAKLTDRQFASIQALPSLLRKLQGLFITRLNSQQSELSKTHNTLERILAQNSLQADALEAFTELTEKLQYQSSEAQQTQLIEHSKTLSALELLSAKSSKQADDLQACRSLLDQLQKHLQEAQALLQTSNNDMLERHHYFRSRFDEAVSNYTQATEKQFAHLSSLTEDLATRQVQQEQLTTHLQNIMKGVMSVENSLQKQLNQQGEKQNLHQQHLHDISQMANQHNQKLSDQDAMLTRLQEQMDMLLNHLESEKAIRDREKTLLKLGGISIKWIRNKA